MRIDNRARILCTRFCPYRVNARVNTTPSTATYTSYGLPQLTALRQLFWMPGTLFDFAMNAYLFDLPRIPFFNLYEASTP